jgi:hypothetical protein
MAVVLELLLRGADPCAAGGAALLAASAGGHAAVVVALLVAGAGASAALERAIREAGGKGHVQVLAALQAARELAAGPGAATAGSNNSNNSNSSNFSSSSVLGVGAARISGSGTIGVSNVGSKDSLTGDACSVCDEEFDLSSSRGSNARSSNSTILFGDDDALRTCDLLASVASLDCYGSRSSIEEAYCW